MLDRLTALAAVEHLAVFGTCDLEPDDDLGPARSLILFGPAEPGFWAHVTAQPEFADGREDPLDRWSARVVTALADQVGGTALFPFGGPPWHPFIRWATRTGRARPSPVGLLVQDEAGLMVSYRGAIALPVAVAHTPTASPCPTCAQPCRSACPVGALSAEGYDTAACHAFLDTPAGQDCLGRGCAVRRACPISQSYGRTEAQSAWHMERFHP